MEIEILNKGKEKLNFILKDINPSIANTLRRIMTSEVPVMAIDDISFTKNSSALYDEILALRFGLIPLKTDLKSYELKEKCTCKGEGCAKCQLNLKLNCKGPCTVYASDLKSQDPKVEPIFSKMPIVKLLKNQELELEAVAVLGKGKAHAKFSPGLVYYKGYPKIKIANNLKNPEKCLNICPVNVYEIKDKVLRAKNITNCTLCNACVEEADPSGAIEVTGSEKDYIFYIESWGQLTPIEIFTEALNMFDENLDEFAAKLKKA
ncbi:MAG: DNA-directed RNA polymerase subunit D [Nanoarchaeota archaeon]